MQVVCVLFYFGTVDLGYYTATDSQRWQCSEPKIDPKSEWHVVCVVLPVGVLMIIGKFCYISPHNTYIIYQGWWTQFWVGGGARSILSIKIKPSENECT